MKGGLSEGHGAHGAISYIVDDILRGHERATPESRITHLWAEGIGADGLDLDDGTLIKLASKAIATGAAKRPGVKHTVWHLWISPDPEEALERGYDQTVEDLQRTLLYVLAKLGVVSLDTTDPKNPKLIEAHRAVLAAVHSDGHSEWREERGEKRTIPHLNIVIHRPDLDTGQLLSDSFCLNEIMNACAEAEAALGLKQHPVKREKPPVEEAELRQLLRQSSPQTLLDVVTMLHAAGWQMRVHGKGQGLQFVRRDDPSITVGAQKCGGHFWRKRNLERTVGEAITQQRLDELEEILEAFGGAPVVKTMHERYKKAMEPLVAKRKAQLPEHLSALTQMRRRESNAIGRQQRRGEITADKAKIDRAELERRYRKLRDEAHEAFRVPSFVRWLTDEQHDGSEQARMALKVLSIEQAKGSPEVRELRRIIDDTVFSGGWRETGHQLEGMGLSMLVEKGKVFIGHGSTWAPGEFVSRDLSYATIEMRSGLGHSAELGMWDQDAVFDRMLNAYGELTGAIGDVTSVEAYQQALARHGLRAEERQVGKVTETFIVVQWPSAEAELAGVLTGDAVRAWEIGLPTLWGVRNATPQQRQDGSGSVTPVIGGGGGRRRAGGGGGGRDISALVEKLKQRGLSQAEREEIERQIEFERNLAKVLRQLRREEEQKGAQRHQAARKPRLTR